jgi:hypothetical protein
MTQKSAGGWSLRKALVRRVAQAVKEYEKELNRPDPKAKPASPPPVQQAPVVPPAAKAGPAEADTEAQGPAEQAEEHEERG